MLSDYFSAEELSELENLAIERKVVKKLMRMQEETLDPGNYLRNQVARLCIRIGVSIDELMESAPSDLLTGKKSGSQLGKLLLIIDKMPKMLEVVSKQPQTGKRKSEKDEMDQPIKRNGASTDQI